jgi:hypothetical protein
MVGFLQCNDFRMNLHDCSLGQCLERYALCYLFYIASYIYISSSIQTILPLYLHFVSLLNYLLCVVEYALYCSLSFPVTQLLGGLHTRRSHLRYPVAVLLRLFRHGHAIPEDAYRCLERVLKPDQLEHVLQAAGYVTALVGGFGEVCLGKGELLGEDVKCLLGSVRKSII